MTNQPVRLGIDASNLRAGGGLTHLTALLSAAHPERCGIERVVLWAGQDVLARMPERPWLEARHDPLLDRPLPWRLLWQRFKLPRLAREHGNLLFVPGGNYQGAFAPVVIECQNLLPFEENERRRYRGSWQYLRLDLLRRQQAETMRRADGVIFLTSYAESVVVGQIGRTRGVATVIPHGVEDRFRCPPRTQKPLADYSLARPFSFLYVSIVDLYKHQWHLAEAVSRLRRDGLPVRLDLVGPAYPPALRRIEATIARLDPQVSFLRYRGPVDHSKLHEVYQAADAFVFASSCENLPNILLEAMASGLPIACSRRGPMPEVLGDAGVYFDPESPEKIAVALGGLLQDADLRERCAERAFQRAQGYSWERCAEATFSFLAEVGRHSWQTAR